MKKLFAGQSWSRSAADWATEPLLEAEVGPSQQPVVTKLTRGPGRTSETVKQQESSSPPWAVLRPSYCPPHSPDAAERQGSPGLPLSQPSHHPDDTPRAADTATTSTSTKPAHHRARAKRTPFQVAQPQAPPTAAPEPLLEPLLPGFSDTEPAQQGYTAIADSGWPAPRDSTVAQNGHTMPQQTVDNVNIVASHVGDRSQFRRSVSISQQPDRHAHAPRRSSDIGSRSSTSGLARATELAMKSGDRDSAPHSPRSPFQRQPSIPSTASRGTIRAPSLLGTHALSSSFNRSASAPALHPSMAEHWVGAHEPTSPGHSFVGLQPSPSSCLDLRQGELVPAHGIHPYPVHPWFSPLHAAGSKVPLTHYSPPHMLPSMFKHPAIDRTHDAVGIWRAAIKWVVLWLTLSVLTILNSIALVVILENDVFALICAIMFCWSGVLGLVGATRTLLGHCLAREHDAEGALEGFHLRSVEILGFTTAALSALASVAHFVSEQVVTRDMHLPACDKGDTHCMEFYNMIIIMMVATTVLYGCHSVVGAVVTFKAHSARRLALAGTTSLAHI